MVQGVVELLIGAVQLVAYQSDYAFAVKQLFLKVIFSEPVPKSWKRCLAYRLK